MIEYMQNDGNVGSISITEYKFQPANCKSVYIALCFTGGLAEKSTFLIFSVIGFWSPSTLKTSPPFNNPNSYSLILQKGSRHKRGKGQDIW